LAKGLAHPANNLAKGAYSIVSRLAFARHA
jgi:hypothetical protein